MPIRVALHHTTEYRYDRRVELGPHTVRLRPAPHCRTPILAYSLKIEPAQHFINWQQDPYSNYQARLVFQQPTDVLRVDVDLIAELLPVNPFDFFLDAGAERWPFTYDAVLARELSPYLETQPAGPLLGQLLQSQQRSGLRTVDYLVGLNRCVQQQVSYIIRMEPGIQTCEETLHLGRGSCRDSAWLLVQLMRHLGLAARFVSGYLIQLRADVKPIDGGAAGPEQDFTDLHAWTEVYLPGAGWVGLDATSGLLAGEGHIPLACAADPTSAAPISGAFHWERRPGEPEDARCGEEFRFHMSVARTHETPRVTLPYTDKQWQTIMARGRQIDQVLRAEDVRLTMGGEPTFVSTDHRDAPEWNTTALGERKRLLAGDLLRRLRNRFAPGGLLHFGQGKWYPGEQLPRWALGCWWRRDGLAIWQDPDLVADDRGSHGHGPAESARFIRALAERLEVDPASAIPGYEDAWYYLWRERRLPTNVDPLQSKLDDPQERERLARIFDQGLNQVVGHALPIRRVQGQWQTGRWFLRREHLVLIPGDSPMGYRLPLDSLPWEPPDLVDAVHELDPLAARQPLPSRRERRQVRGVQHDDGYAERNGRADGIVRTALCIEPRGGTLHVFMPPQRCTEDYLELAAAIEATAADLAMPIRIEGYTPPRDYRLNHFAITPDPGVIEVNIHPAHDWDELVCNTTTLYEEARQAGLTTEKFQIDGRPTGTGGGNHVVLGGPTPADSPLLRRPDLLRSLVAFWHNHPSLSYLFGGLFLGPTSQAPRIDEARNDSLYEMELAFQQIESNRQPPLWLVDRLFRNLLVDVTGNTHRAEFCIDKLYSPDSVSGRLGLVELRSFEMPPHERMSLVQQLLLRACVANFWQTPYQRPLVRWGTELHDRFMLPHFVAQDFGDVLEELRLAGFPLEETWFAPHQEFRFPLIGSVTYRGVNLELRPALEPWHVLGEEAAAGGQTRYVDSSVERIQVKVCGMVDIRHVVSCNGRRVPLHPTGTVGEYVAGVRFRAWQPPSCLHPTIPVHGPLVFDVIDTWQDRSLGGCTYFVSHPGGRSFDLLPVNALEAESRWKVRFWPFGHTAGEVAVPAAEPHPEFPLTLDLRQAGQLPAARRKNLRLPEQAGVLS